MNCKSPLIKINNKDSFLCHRNNDKLFVSYKHFTDKWNLNKLVSTKQIQLIGCGKCIGCRQFKMQDWVKRLTIEFKNWKNVYFITLTYDNNNRTYNLKVRDLQLFIKRYRRYLDYHFGLKMRYFACGEYGEQSHREHFHVIVFSDYFITDLKKLKTTKNGVYYSSDLISKFWKNGHCVVCYSDISSFGYVCKYNMKSCSKSNKNYNIKLINDAMVSAVIENDENSYVQLNNDLIRFLNFKPSFITMSKKPSIGSSILESDKIDWNRVPSSLLKRLDNQAVKDKRYDYFLESLSNISIKNKIDTFISVKPFCKNSKNDV